MSPGFYFILLLAVTKATRALRRSPNIDWDDHLTGKGDLLLGLRSAHSPREREPEAYRITTRPRLGISHDSGFTFRARSQPSGKHMPGGTGVAFSSALTAFKMARFVKWPLVTRLLGEPLIRPLLPGHLG